MRHLKTLLTVLGGITLLVLAGNTVALATTGHSFILGTSNTAGSATTLTRTTSGSVLSLHAASAMNAPLAVNAGGKVAHLNADLLDGFDSSVMRNRTYAYTVPVNAPISGFAAAVALPKGDYTFGYSAFPQTAGTTGTSSCQVHRTRGATNSFYGLAQSGESASGNPSMNGTGQVSLIAGDTLAFECFTPTNFTSLSTAPIQIYFVPTTLAANATLTPGPLP